jgi:hypothetical protein
LPRRTKSQKKTVDLLNQLDSNEAAAVLHRLLERHPELRAEAEEMAKDAMASCSIEDIAADVSIAVTGLDLDALNGRAGKHSWGYMEPSEAAWELLEEAVEDFVDDMKRKVEADLMTAAETVCVGIVAGLSEAEGAKSEDVLGWAPDFPAEHAGHIVEEFLKLTRDKMNKSEREQFCENLVTHAPGWEEMLRRAFRP